MITLRQGVHDFIAALELTESEQTDAARQHANLREGLAKKLSLDPDHGTFLTGSYIRSTAIRPLKDIDVFCVLNRTDDLNPAQHDPVEALRAVKKALDALYPGKVAEPQNRSVNIEFSGTGIAYDVVPAFVDADAVAEVFLIPDLAAGRWIRSNPRVHREKSVAANAAAGSELKPLTKAVKHWNRGLNKEARLRSFHIEVMAWATLTQPPESRLQGLLTLFRGLADKALLSTPDPAGLGPPVDDGLTLAQRTGAADRFRSAAADIERADGLAKDGKVAEAHHILFTLFGSPYPEKGKAAVASVGPVIVSASGPDGDRSRFG